MTAPGTIRTRGQHTDRDRTTVAGRGVADRSRAKARPARSTQRTAEPTRRGSAWDTNRTSAPGRSTRRFGGSRVGSRQQGAQRKAAWAFGPAGAAATVR